MGRKKHPNSLMTVQWPESKGWRYQATGKSSHAWGRLLCPLKGREGCQLSIWSTPKNEAHHVRQIKKRVKQCSHQH